jgi:hypothetical protein
MRTGHLGLVWCRLADGEDVLDLTEVVRHDAVDGLPDNQEVGRFGRVLKDRRAEEVVVDDLGDFALVDVAEQEGLGVAWIEDGRLTKVELESARFHHPPPAQHTLGT